MNRLKIVFIGCVEFSALALKKMIQQEYPPVAVLTKSKSDFNSDFVDLQPIANANGIPSKSVIDINHLANVEWIKNWEPDVIFCFGWSSLIKVDILNIPSLGVIGFHPSLLPFNRGRHPIIWALVLGLREAGVGRAEAKDSARMKSKNIDARSARSK